VDIIVVFVPSDYIENGDDGLPDHSRRGWLLSKAWSQYEYFQSWGSAFFSPRQWVIKGK
jgi:hypothetical protein